LQPHCGLGVFCQLLQFCFWVVGIVQNSCFWMHIFYTKNYNLFACASLDAFSMHFWVIWPQIFISTIIEGFMRNCHLSIFWTLEDILPRGNWYGNCLLAYKFFVLEPFSNFFLLTSCYYNTTIHCSDCWKRHF